MMAGRGYEEGGFWGAGNGSLYRCMWLLHRCVSFVKFLTYTYDLCIFLCVYYALKS